MKITAAGLEARMIAVRDADNSECVCGEPITVHRMRWQCSTCGQRHVATVCFNCSRTLDAGTDHAEPYRVALVAAADALFCEAIAEESGSPLEAVLEGDVSAEGPARHFC